MLSPTPIDVCCVVWQIKVRRLETQARLALQQHTDNERSRDQLHQELGEKRLRHANFLYWCKAIIVAFVAVKRTNGFTVDLN